MKITVFGGSGFLGSHVADTLSFDGHEVTIFDIRPSSFKQPNQKFIKGSILDKDLVDSAIKNADVVYNFAGISDLNYSINNPYETLHLNILGNINILNCAVENKVERYIYASTVYVYSSSGSFYGISKQTSEKVIEEFAKDYNLKYTILRYGSVYGDRADQKNRIFRLIKDALDNDSISFNGNGKEVREYIHVRDAASLSSKVLSEEFENQNVILTGVERYSYLDVLKMIQEILGKDLEIHLKGEDYQGHYHFTPYSYSPSPGKKLVANPFIDFGQGLLEMMKEIDHIKCENGILQ